MRRKRVEGRRSSQFESRRSREELYIAGWVHISTPLDVTVVVSYARTNKHREFESRLHKPQSVRAPATKRGGQAVPTFFVATKSPPAQMELPKAGRENRTRLGTPLDPSPLLRACFAQLSSIWIALGVTIKSVRVPTLTSF